MEVLEGFVAARDVPSSRDSFDEAGAGRTGRPRGKDRAWPGIRTGVAATVFSHERLSRHAEGSASSHRRQCQGYDDVGGSCSGLGGRRGGNAPARRGKSRQVLGAAAGVLAPGMGLKHMLILSLMLLPLFTNAGSPNPLQPGSNKMMPGFEAGAPSMDGKGTSMSGSAAGGAGALKPADRVQRESAFGERGGESGASGVGVVGEIKPTPFVRGQTPAAGGESLDKYRMGAASDGREEAASAATAAAAAANVPKLRPDQGGLVGLGKATATMADMTRSMSEPSNLANAESLVKDSPGAGGSSVTAVGGKQARGMTRARSGRRTQPAIFRVQSMGAFPSLDSYAFSHNENLGFSMFLERRCKWVWFIRHAEAEHNLAEREHELGTKFLLEEHSGWKYWDASLTENGKNQCDVLRKELEEMEHYLDWELCVVSPLQRTLQTAKLTVGAVRHDGAPIKFLATEMCRERITCCPADSRRPLSVCKKEFPEVDFSQVTNEQDVSWHTDKENDEQCKQRGIKFLSWLAKRPESCIAVVTHSGFLKRLFEQFGMGIASEDMEELHRRPANCEMRGLVLCAHRQFGGGSADLVLMPEGDFPRF